MKTNIIAQTTTDRNFTVSTVINENGKFETMVFGRTAGGQCEDFDEVECVIATTEARAMRNHNAMTDLYARGTDEMAFFAKFLRTEKINVSVLS